MPPATERLKKQAAKRKEAAAAAEQRKDPLVQHAKRERTSIRFGPAAAAAVDKIVVEMGLSKNAFFVMSVLLQAVKLAAPMNDNAELLKALEDEFKREPKRARAE